MKDVYDPIDASPTIDDITRCVVRIFGSLNWYRNNLGPNMFGSSNLSPFGNMNYGGMMGQMMPNGLPMSFNNSNFNPNRQMNSFPQNGFNWNSNSVNMGPNMGYNTPFSQNGNTQQFSFQPPMMQSFPQNMMDPNAQM